LLVPFVAPGVKANVPGCVKPLGGLLSVMVTDAVELEIYAGRRAVAPVLLSPGMVIVNRASASGPVYGAAVLAGVGAACGKDAPCEPPPPHAASDTASAPANSDEKRFLHCSRLAANRKNSGGAIRVVRSTVCHQT